MFQSKVAILTRDKYNVRLTPTLNNSGQLQPVHIRRPSNLFAFDTIAFTLYVFGPRKSAGQDDSKVRLFSHMSELHVVEGVIVMYGFFLMHLVCST